MKQIEYGKKYKYTELCEIMNEPHFRGSYLQNQIERWRKNYEIQRVNNGYIIQRAYTEQEKRNMAIRGKYVKLFSVALARLLSKSEGHTLICSTMDLLIKSGMVNSDYKIVKYHINESATIIDTDSEQLETYANKSYSALSHLVKDMLAQLEDKSLILNRRGFRLYKNSGDQTIIQDIPLGSIDEQIIIHIENSTLKEMGISYLSDLYRSEYSLREFKKKTTEKCRTMFNGWDGYFSTHHITLDKDGLMEYEATTTKELNDAIQNKLLTTESLLSITELPKLVKATIDLDCPYQIKDKIRRPN